MLGEPETWHALMTALTDVTIAFLQVQVDAGVDAIQVFDSWAGTLSLADYRGYVLPHTARVFAALARAGVPMTHFGVGTAELLGAMCEAVAGRGAPGVVGVDWRTSLADAAARVDPGIALQGNLDPVVLLAGWPVVERAVRAVVEDGRRAVDAGAAATCSTSATACCPPPIRASSPRPSSWCTRCDGPLLRCRRRYLGSRRRIPAAGGERPGRGHHRVRPRRPARRGAAHRAGRRPATRRRGGGLHRPSARGACAAGRAGSVGPADRHHRGAAADLQPGPAAPDAAGHAAGHPGAGFVAGRPGRRRHAGPGGRRGRPPADVAPQR